MYLQKHKERRINGIRNRREARKQVRMERKK